MVENDKELDEYIFIKNAQNTSDETSADESETTETTDNNVDKSVEESSLPVITDEAKSIELFRTSAIGNITSQVQEGKLDVDDALKQFVNATAIINAVKDPVLNQELTKNAGKSLKSHSRSINYKDEANAINKRTARNEAFYKAFRPILEFDLSHLVGTRRKKIVTKDPATGKKTVSYEDLPEKEQKTYADRSYGLFMMIVMLALLIVPYCAVNVILALFNALNAIFECFTKFGRTAFYLSTSIAAIAIIGLVIYVILLVIQAAFGVQIFR